MNIRLININNDDSDIENIRRLYHTAFPSDERAPFWVLVRRAEKNNINFFSCRDGDTWIGFIYVVNHRDLSYIYYLAIDENSRGKGYGTAVLKAAQKKYADRRLFLVIEEVEKKIRQLSAACQQASLLRKRRFSENRSEGTGSKCYL